MSTKNYETESIRLSKAIDIAISAFKRHPLKIFTEADTLHTIKVYEEWKDSCLNPGPKFRTLASLKYKIQDAFTIFQEGSGEAIEYFWKEIKNQNLGYVRENKLEKVLKRGKLKNRDEYDFVTDVLVPYKQKGMIDEEQFEKLSLMIGAFESKKIK